MVKTENFLSNHSLFSYCHSWLFQASFILQETPPDLVALLALKSLCWCPRHLKDWGSAWIPPMKERALVEINESFFSTWVSSRLGNLEKKNEPFVHSATLKMFIADPVHQIEWWYKLFNFCSLHFGHSFCCIISKTFHFWILLAQCRTTASCFWGTGSTKTLQLCIDACDLVTGLLFCKKIFLCQAQSQDGLAQLFIFLFDLLLRSCMNLETLIMLFFCPRVTIIHCFSCQCHSLLVPFYTLLICNHLVLCTNLCARFLVPPTPTAILLTSQLLRTADLRRGVFQGGLFERALIPRAVSCNIFHLYLTSESSHKVSRLLQLRGQGLTSCTTKVL